MQTPAWAAGLDVAITVCDADGIILDMNDKAAKTFEKDGGRDLIGRNVLDCHPEPSRTTLRNMLAQHNTNAYTIEKNGVKKLIYQTAWQKEGKFAGIVELSLEIPFDMPHFIRQP
jgi:transcriptional regulator with PAS, ATPase and Fis domain